MKNAINLFLSRLKADKRLAVIVIAGAVGIILLTASELIPESNSEKNSNESNDNLSCSEYEENLENRLEKLISSIDGAGDVTVMVTLESGDENVYAIEHKQSSSDNNEQSENEYVLIEKDGDNGGLLLKVVEPEVRGVAIVCDGADSAQVKQEIINTVTAVLGITTNRVNISKKGGNQ